MSALDGIRAYLEETSLGGNHPLMVVIPRPAAEALVAVAEAAEAWAKSPGGEDGFVTARDLRAALASLREAATE